MEVLVRSNAEAATDSMARTIANELRETRAKALSPGRRAQNEVLFIPPDEMPCRTITMGVGTSLEARHCLLLAIGEDKAKIVARAIEGPVTSMISATPLQFHRSCTAVLDEAAASGLREMDYYRWIFEIELHRNLSCNGPEPRRPDAHSIKLNKQKKQIAQR